MQDDWKVTPRLTVNLGFRYDLAPAPTARHNWLSTGFDLNVTNPLDSLALESQFPNLQGGKLEGGYTFATSGSRSAAWNTDLSLIHIWLFPGYTLKELAGRPGFEPGQMPPKGIVLPLDDRPKLSNQKHLAPVLHPRQRAGQ